MFGLVRRVLAGAASYWSPDPPLVKDNPPEYQEPDNTICSPKEESPSNIASIVEQAMNSATGSRAPSLTPIDNDEWDSRLDAKFKAREGTGIARMQTKRTKIVTPEPVEKPKPIEEPTVATSEDEGSGIPRMGSDLGTPQPVEEHTDTRRWVIEEKKWLEQEEKKQRAATYAAILAKIAELEQRLNQRAEDDRKTNLANIAEINQQVVKKVDKEQVDQHSCDVASLAARVDKIEENASRLETQYHDLSEKLTLVEQNQGAVATAIAGAEEPQAKTGGCDPEELSALTTKTDGHNQRIEDLETRFGAFEPEMIQAASDWFNPANGKFDIIEKYFMQMGDIPDKVKQIEGANEQHGQILEESLTKQKESFEQQLKQQKEASDKELKDCKEYMQEQMNLKVESIRKECEERLASKDKEFAEYVAKTDAEQKAQNERTEALEKTVQAILTQINNPQNTTPQVPATGGQGQQPPIAQPPQPAPAPQGNGPRPSTPTPSVPGQPPADSDVQMGGASNSGGVPNPDTKMDDAPNESLKQHGNQASQEDTPMDSVEPMIPNNNGNMGFMPLPQPMGGNQLFPNTGRAQSAFQAPVPSGPTLQGLKTSRWNTPVPSGTGPSTPTPQHRPSPTEKRNDRRERDLFGSVPRGPRVPAGESMLLDPPATPSETPAPNKFNFNSPLPKVDKPQMNWSASMEKVNLDPPASEMDIDDDVKPLAPKAKQPLTNAAPATPQVAQPAPINAPSANTGGADTVMTNGSSSTAVGPTSAPTNPSAPNPQKKKAEPSVFMKKPAATPSKSKEVTSKVQTTTTPAQSFAQKKQAIFNEKFSNTLTTYKTPPAPLAPMKSPSYTGAPHNPEEIPGLTCNNSPYALKPKTPSPAPQPPSPAFTPVTAAPNPTSSAVSPVYKRPTQAYSPTSPTYQPPPPGFPSASPAYRPYSSSPLAKHAATSGTIQSATSTNVFTKEVEKPVEKPSEANDNSAPEETMGDAGDAAAAITEPSEPAANPGDIQMSEAESKPEATKPLKYESDINPRKHQAAVQIVPSDDAKIVKRETEDDAAKAHKSGSQDDAKVPTENSPEDPVTEGQDSQGEAPMQIDRRVAKAKGKAAKLGEGEAKRRMEEVMQESAWEAMEKAAMRENAEKLKAEAAAADDVVDYGDPNDINDEDVHITTMLPPKPNLKPTKYKLDFFIEWKLHFLSYNILTTEARKHGCKGTDDQHHFVKKVREMDENNDMDFLISEAKLSVTKKAFEKYEMDMLFSAFREETFFEALRGMDLDDLYDDFKDVRGRMDVDWKHWFRTHKPDAV